MASAGLRVRRDARRIDQNTVHTAGRDPTHSPATLPPAGSDDENDIGIGIPRPHHVKTYLKKVMDRADESGKRSIMPHLREIRHMHKLFMDTDDYLTALK